MITYGDTPPLIQAEICSHSSNYEELDHLRPFTCNFETTVHEEGEELRSLGAITGWFALSCLDRDIADEGDAISHDSMEISQVAHEYLRDQDWNEELIENTLLINRIRIDPDLRGRGYLAPMVNALVSAFGLTRVGCLLVTRPEPQQSGGGPYPDGDQRDKALAGLQRALASAGFEPYDDGSCYLRAVPVH